MTLALKCKLLAELGALRNVASESMAEGISNIMARIEREGCDHSYTTLATETWEVSAAVGGVTHHSKQIVVCSKCGDCINPVVEVNRHD